MTTTLHSLSPASGTPATGTSPPNAGVLRTRLARYEAQLADSCNCPSSKTAEGKRRIAVLQQQADAVKAQIQQIDAGRARASEVRTATAVRAPAVEGALVDVYA